MDWASGNPRICTDGYESSPRYLSNTFFDKGYKGHCVRLVTSFDR